eukprot:COSAG05_NODE_988_length_6284_cov_7.662571_7_plen_65_part_00
MLTEIYLHILSAHYGLYGNAPVLLLAGAAGVAVMLLQEADSARLSVCERTHGTWYSRYHLDLWN